MKPIYTAIFLDAASKETLLKAFPPLHPKVFGHHVTLVFKPNEEALKTLEPHLEKEVEFQVVGVASDTRGHCVQVTVPENLRINGQTHHVTISCAEGVTPVYSNELLKTGLTWQQERLPLCLKGVVRHFTK